MLLVSSPIGRRRVCVSATWIVSLAVLSFLSFLQLVEVEGFGCYRSNFIGISSNAGTALYMNLPGQVSKKVIVTGAGKFYTCVCCNSMHIAYHMICCNSLYLTLYLGHVDYYVQHILQY